MLPQRVVDEFLARELRDSNRAKQFVEEALDQKIAELPNTQNLFHTVPRIHQKVSFLLGAKYPMYELFLDPGLGKTKCFLDLTNFWMRQERVKRSLVLVPNSSNIYSWKNQVKLHTPNLSIVGIDGSGTEERLEQLHSGADVVVSTYMGWLALVCGGKDPDKDGNIPKGWKIDEKKARVLSSQFQLLGLDEITQCANHVTLMHRSIRRLLPFCPQRYGLTGTPFGKNVELLWGVFKLIDDGETLGDTLALFRSAFFKEKRDYFSGFPIYEFDKAKEETLHRVIRHRSIRYREEECLDLPQIVENQVKVSFSAETWAYYDSLIEKLKGEHGDYRAVENVYHQMCMLRSGFLGVMDPEGDRSEIIFKENPLLDALMDRVDEIPLDRKLVIFHYYNVTGQLITDRLKAKKLKHVWLWSKTKDKQGIQKKFDEDDNCRIMVSSTAGAFGNNWQVANYVEFFETPTCPKLRKQMWKRCHRDGQQHKVFITDYVVRRSLDAKRLKSIVEGTDLMDSVMDGIRDGTFFQE